VILGRKAKALEIFDLRFLICDFGLRAYVPPSKIKNRKSKIENQKFKGCLAAEVRLKNSSPPGFQLRFISVPFE
jgi:hypothetical protein